MNEYRQKLLKEIGIKISESNLSYEDWLIISSNGKLSEEFMREFKQKIHWRVTYIHQTISDDFLIELQDTMNWSYYFILAKPSFTIAKKFITKTNPRYFDSFNLSHFDDIQINKLQRILDVKNVFQKNNIKLKKTT